VELDPKSVVKNLDLFEVYLRRREYSKAERHVNRALELEPDSPAYIYKAILVIARDGNMEAAVAVLKEEIQRAGMEASVFWAPQFDIGAAIWQRLDSTAQAALDRLSIDRFGADSSGYYLAKARSYRYRGNLNTSRIYFDSAAVVLEKRVQARPDDPAIRSSLSFAYTGLGRRDAAIREGQRAVELRPPSKDTWLGVDMVRNLAVAYATLGEADSAVKQLRFLLSVPSWISKPWLRADPTWDPIRRHAGFKALVEKD
jgi:tetratricopeptide (TPR) repeat protein